MPAKKSAPASSFSFGAAPVAPTIVKTSSSKMKSIPVAGVESLSVLRTFEAMVKAARVLIEANVRDAASSIYVGFGITAGKKPDLDGKGGSSFIGTEGVETATCTFAKRSSASVLTSDEQALLTEFNVPFVTTVTPSTFVFNSDYIDDPVWREKIQNALNTIENLPGDIIIMTEESQKITVDETAIDAIFKKNDPTTVLQLLPVVTSLRLKPKSNMTTDLLSLLAKAGQVLGLPQMADLMSKAVNDPDEILKDDYGKKSSKKRASKP